jgi:hypothetical protein
MARNFYQAKLHAFLEDGVQPAPYEERLFIIKPARRAVRSIA